MRRSTLRVAAVLTCSAYLALPAPAWAAVGVCSEVLSGKLAEARTELEAKRSALESWREGARLVGEGYTRWEIAWKRRIDCKHTADGRYQCRAIGQPCTISQVPPEQFERLPRSR